MKYNHVHVTIIIENSKLNNSIIFLHQEDEEADEKIEKEKEKEIETSMNGYHNPAMDKSDIPGDRTSVYSVDSSVQYETHF